MIENSPVLAICGFSGAGKTTLILKVLRYLCEDRGLAVALELSGPKHLQLKLTRAKLEQLTEDLVDRCRAPFEQALKDAKLSASAIDEVVLVGGSTRIPAVLINRCRLLPTRCPQEHNFVPIRSLQCLTVVDQDGMPVAAASVGAKASRVPNPITAQSDEEGNLFILSTGLSPTQDSNIDTP